MAAFNLIARVILALALAVACSGARADTKIDLLKTFTGNVNFVGIQQTLRNKGNNKPCEVYDPGSERSARLPAIPATASIVSAHLYWAGSGKTPDYRVFFDDVAITAPSGRQYSSATIGGGFDYFSGAADVTAQVKANYADKKKNHKYTFRGLTVSTGSPYCANEGVLGGFALLVIYTDASEPLRMLNLYEGFQFMRYTGITLNLSGFRVPNPLGTATGRVGHLTWEGDSTLEGIGENLKFNDVEMKDNQNPAGNQFNSRSNIDGDPKSYGIDFDAYTLSDPVIKGGQTAATTRYESGQDLVLLGAEIVAMPNVPTADLSIALQLDDELVSGQTADYTVRVANAGPSTETGPTVVTSTLPVGLSYDSAGGIDWACTNTGQTVRCINSTPVLSGQSLPVLTITVRVTGTGTITNSVLVTGAMYDPQLANNAASVDAVVSAGAAPYTLTHGACVNKLPFGDANQTCKKALQAVKAGLAANIYITALVDGVPTGPIAGRTVSMQFAMSCHNPIGPAPVGVRAVYAGQPLKLCQTEGKTPTDWSTSTNITFAANTPSVEKSFTYDDVGQVQLFMFAAVEKVMASGPAFVSVPFEIHLTKPGGEAFSDVALNATSSVFTRAGIAFNLEAGAFAYTTGSTPKRTPNFGREKEPVRFTTPAVSKGALENSSAWNDMHDKVPKLEALIDFAAVANGFASGQFSWPEVGVIKLTPVLNVTDYLGQAYTVKDAYLGRFIPHHFATAAKRMTCRPNMLCDVDPEISTAAYSRQKLPVIVTALSAGDAPTMNYRGVYARNLALSAWADPRKGDVPKEGLSKNDVEKKKFDESANGTAQAGPEFSFLTAFKHTDPLKQTDWVAPTSIYLRADEVGGDGVTSKSDTNAHEVGIRIVSGRLLVPSAHGSERLNLPLKLSAQYWTGTQWELSQSDDHNLIDSTKAVFSDAGNLSLKLLPGMEKVLVAGATDFAVQVTPAAAGKADVVIDYLAWLPSTKGRLKFGTNKSPLIYVRERH